MLRIERVFWDEARADASRIRSTVFVDEQQVPAEMEMDENDPHCVHALAYSAERMAIGTGRLLPDGHVGRMAVLKAWRGRGVGGAIIERLVAAARKRGDAQVVLSAQIHALEFYRRHGFVEEGGVYEEAGIAHQAMRRKI